jgi:hypothetical protein
VVSKQYRNVLSSMTYRFKYAYIPGIILVLVNGLVYDPAVGHNLRELIPGLAQELEGFEECIISTAWQLLELGLRTICPANSDLCFFINVAQERPRES